MANAPRDPRRESVILHYLPAEVLRKAQALARRFERDEALRSYAVRRLWYVLPALLFVSMYLFFAVLSAVSSGVETLALSDRIAKLGAIGLGILVWFIAILSVLYATFSWLEKRALRALATPGQTTSRRRTGRTIALMIVLALVAGLAYCAHSVSTAEQRMRTTCAAINPGMPLSELKDFAERHGLFSPTRESGSFYLAERRSFGRHACKVTLEKGIVKQSEYGYAD